jgi:hypothetical protein
MRAPPSLSGRHPKTFTLCDIHRCPLYGRFRG